MENDKEEIPKVLEQAKWKVREGKVSFWLDSWAGEGPLADSFVILASPMLKVRECKLDNEWNVLLLERLVGVEKTEDIIEELGNP